MMPSAQARYLYWEVGVGLGSLGNPATAFSSLASITSGSYTLALNTGLFFTIIRTRPVEFHLGAKSRWTNLVVGTSPDNGYATVLSVAPILRIETSRFYIGGGYIPYALKRYDTAFGFTNWTPLATQMWGWTAEAALLWRMTPLFHLALEGSVEYYTINGTTKSPAPVWQATVQFRFFPFSYPKSRGAEDVPSGHYDGWRYPFGIPLK